MNRICASCLCVAAICGGTLLPADNATPASPKDGTWSKYYVILRRDNGTEVRFTNKISILGGEQWNGEPCRWVEIEEFYEGQDKPQIHKLLVPEKELLQAERPLDDVKRYISKSEDQVTVHDDDSLGRTHIFGPTIAFFPGALNGTKAIAEPKEVDYQTGKLRIENGRKGSYTWKRKYKLSEGSEFFQWDYVMWMHSDVPFGFAHSRMKLSRKSTADEKARITEYEYLLKETGTGAKSAIADGGG